MQTWCVECRRIVLVGIAAGSMQSNRNADHPTTSVLRKYANRKQNYMLGLLCEVKLDRTPCTTD